MSYPYDKRGGDEPTRAYSSPYLPAGSTDPAYRRGAEDYPDERQPDPAWGAPAKPQAMNLPKFMVPASIVAIVAGAVAWALVELVNKLPVTAGGALVHRDSQSAAIGTALLTLAAAGALVGLVYQSARPGLVFIVLAVALVIVLLVWAWIGGALSSWQACISTGLLNTLLIAAVATVLYALGRATVNTNIVKDY